MRGLVVAAAPLALVFSGCMQGASPPAQHHDWTAFDSGRGLIFGMLLAGLLLAGIAVLVTNISASRSPAPGRQPTMPPVAPSGWQPIEEPPDGATPEPRPNRPAAPKSAKPRRRTP